MKTELNSYRTIHFKNGATVRIDLKTAKELRDRYDEGFDSFEIFTDEDDNPYLFLDVHEILFIN